MRLAQIQVCPMFRNLEDTAAATALSRSASSKTMKGALPPNSSEIRLTCAASPRLTRIAGRDEIHHTRWETCFLKDLEEGKRGEGGLLRRFQHHGTSGRQRRRDLPCHHGGREIPGRNGRYDADWLLDDQEALVSHRGRDGLAVHPLYFLCIPCDEPGGVLDLPLGFLQRLALFRGENPGELFFALEHQGCRPQEELGPLWGSECCPPGEGSMGRLGPG